MYVLYPFSLICSLLLKVLSFIFIHHNFTIQRWDLRAYLLRYVCVMSIAGSNSEEERFEAKQ